MSLSVDIRKRLGDFQLEVQFDAGDEALALLGASGSGKSMTLRCIAGTLRPDEGRIVLDGRTLYDSAAKIDLPPQKRQVGYLFQQYALFPNMTVRQNIAAAVPSRGLRASVTAEELRRFRLEEVADLHPRQLSGGQQQRTALARILASSPRILLLDEPFAALDNYLRFQLELELMETLDRFDRTVLWVSHDRGEVYRNCRRVCVMDRGRSQGVETLEDLFRRPRTEAAARLSGCKNYARAVPAGDRVALPDWGVSLDCGGPVPADTAVAGVRSHHIRPAAGHEANQIPCELIRVIEDVFSVIVLLRPLGAAAEALPLRMKLSKDEWARLSGGRQLTVTVAPEHILLLRSEGGTNMFKAMVLTVSDRSFRGERPDAGGPLVASILQEAGFEVARTAIVPDQRPEIEAALRESADSGEVALIVTTGGTGFAPRDVTPEATLAVCDRMTPGIPEAMRYASMQVTNRAMLSRAQAGIRGGALIINLPGSPKAARENLEAVLPALRHGLEMLAGGPADCAKLPN